MSESSFWRGLSFLIFPSPLLFLLVAVALKCLLVSFYFWLLYYALCAVKRLRCDKIGVRTGYYSWYLLLLSLPISGMSFNGFFKLPIYGLYAGPDNPKPLAWMVCGILAILWLLVVYYRMTAHIVTNLKLEGAFSVMKECSELGDLKQRAAAAFGLHIKRIMLVASDAVNSPISYGFVRKTVILPCDYRGRYSDSELYTLLLHEMAHIKNGDTVKYYLLRFAQCFLILPPGFFRNFKRDTEILCDNRVMSAVSADTDTYADLLVRECSGRVTALKGLAFSDSFRDIESRINAIYSSPPVSHRLSVFSVAIALALSAAFAWSFVFPDTWFISNRPVDRELNIYVLFDSEEYWAEQVSRVDSYRETGLIPAPPSDRPDTAYFNGTYERLPDGSVRIDRLALREAVMPLEKDGEKVSVIWFCFYNYTLSAEHIFVAEYPIFVDDLMSFDESERYMFVINHPSESYPLEEYMYTSAAHWL